MRILFLGNNWLSWQILKWLREEGEVVVGLVIHPPCKCKYGDEILDAAGLDSSEVFEGSYLQKPKTIKAIEGLNPDIGISVLFDYILGPEFLSIFKKGVINLHPALLPYNRGQYPNVWSIVEGTPSGVTLHYIDKGIDTGAIISQRKVNVEPVDTGETLYRKLEQIGLELFKVSWPVIKAGNVKSVKQTEDIGKYHRTTDVDKIDCIDLDKSYKARDLINVLRARTFPPYKSAYFETEGRKVYMQLKLEYEDN